MASDDLIKLDVTDSMVGDLTALIRNVDNLGKIISAATEVGQQLGTNAIAKSVAGKTGLSTTEVKESLLALLNVYQFSTRIKKTSKSMFNTLSYSLRATGVKEYLELADRWDAASNKIVSALGQIHPDHTLVIASKAFRAAMTHQYVLADMRIFTDLRPVFDDAGDSILQAVITHVLSIDYNDGGDHRIIQFSLDAADIRDLKELCGRAERKGMVVKRELSNLPWPTTIFREPTEPQN